MHRLRNEPRMENAPQTAGSTIHWAGEYDLMTGLMGLGVKGANSRMVIELAGIKPGEKVLDVGCGTGNLTLAAKLSAGPGGEVHGIDAAPEMIAVARRKAQRTHLDVTFDVGLIEQIPFPDATFDAVINRLMMHHLPEDLKRAGLAEILRVLKPGGRLLIADFTPPSNHVLHHLASVLVGPRMMHTDTWSLPPLVTAAGFVETTSGPTRSAFLAFVSGRKPG